MFAFSIPAINLGPVQVLALAAAGVVAGDWIRGRLPVVRRLGIPASIIGGLLYALAILFLHARGVDVRPDAVVRDVLMLTVFTVIGMNASLRVLRLGGLEVALLLALASAGAVLQNLLGMGLAKLMGVHPLVGILAGAVSLAGGPATSLAFGPTFERAGVSGAATIALASATFGIVVSGLLSGTVGAFLIQRHSLVSSGAGPARAASRSAESSTVAGHVALIAIAMGLGSIVSVGIERAGLVLPGYIGAMIVAALIRNTDDRYRCFRISATHLSSVFAVALPLFIVMAMLSLRLWELAAIGAPVAVILAAQVVLALAMSVAMFRAMRRDFDSAVMATGYCGFMLGITANALATMDDLTRRFGPAPRAFVVLPMVGAFLIDFSNALIITAMANFVR